MLSWRKASAKTEEDVDCKERLTNEFCPYQTKGTAHAVSVKAADGIGGIATKLGCSEP